MPVGAGAASSGRCVGFRLRSAPTATGEAYAFLVGAPVFKTGEGRYPVLVGSIPIRLRRAHPGRGTVCRVDDPFALQRFLDAQDRHGTYDTALAELTAGRKRSHWIWFVFPQLRGLGHSLNAERYGITGLAEAQAYVAHPVLGSRLRECVRVLRTHAEADPGDVMGGSLDAQKLRSSMTLFARAAPDDPGFREVLAQWFDGLEDPATTSRL